MPCKCCNKENQFCRCDRQTCANCSRCGVHCECMFPKLAPTLERPKGDRATCKSPTCGAVIYWRVTAAGKRMPFDEDGTTPHWATCKDVGKFRKRKAVKGERQA